MNEIDIYKRMGEIAETPHFSMLFGEDSERTRKIADHREWLKSIRHERPSTEVPFKVAIYIRYFNQTRYDNYLAYHKKQFADTVALCPKWTLVDFYVDEGSTAPNMESAPEWTRLLDDAFDGKVDLIITQKVSNVSKRTAEVALCSRLLAAQDPPSAYILFRKTSLHWLLITRRISGILNSFHIWTGSRFLNRMM